MFFIIQFLNNPKKLFWTKYEDQRIKIAMFLSKKHSLQNNLQTNPLTDSDQRISLGGYRPCLITWKKKDSRLR